MPERPDRKMASGMEGDPATAAQSPDPTAIVAARALEVSHHSGPLPAPQLGEYNQVLPGLADRIVSAMENQSAHRIGLEKAAQDADIQIGLRIVSVAERLNCSLSSSILRGSSLGPLPQPMLRYTANLGWPQYWALQAWEQRWFPDTWAESPKGIAVLSRTHHWTRKSDAGTSYVAGRLRWASAHRTLKTESLLCR